MADDNKTIEQQNQVLDSQDSISSSSDTFPASGNEVFTSETYSTAKSGPDALAEDLGEVGQAGAVIYIQHINTTIATNITGQTTLVQKHS